MVTDLMRIILSYVYAMLSSGTIIKVFGLSFHIYPYIIGAAKAVKDYTNLSQV